jgi:AraC-like DNA-binding protein
MKIYKNHELKITDVSQLLGTNRTYVSELINDKFSCSFVEFVNKYRLDEAKMLLNENPEASIQDVAEQAGFGSTGTFIRVFKNRKGLLPENTGTAGICQPVVPMALAMALILCNRLCSSCVCFFVSPSFCSFLHFLSRFHLLPVQRVKCFSPQEWLNNNGFCAFFQLGFPAGQAWFSGSVPVLQATFPGFHFLFFCLKQGCCKVS